MIGFPLKSWVCFLLLLTLFFLLASPSSQDSLPVLQGKLSLPSIKTESLSSVNKRGGGGGSRGGGGGSRGGHSSSGKGGRGLKGKGTSGRGRAIPVYAGGAAAAGSNGHHRNGAVLINPGKANLGLSMLVLAITLFKYFLAC